MSERIVAHPPDYASICWVLLAGKRFIGKDTLATMLVADLAEQGKHAIVRSTAYPLKAAFCAAICAANGLDFNQYLYDRAYKEQYRDKFSAWVVTQSPETNFNNFLMTIPRDEASKPKVVVVSDARNPYDVDRFQAISSWVWIIRVLASNEAREARGWKPSNYDNSDFETGMDKIPVDWEFDNSGELAGLHQFSLQISKIISDSIQKPLRPAAAGTGGV